MKAVPLILLVIRQPEFASELSLRDWDLLIRQARQANLLARLAVLIEQQGLLDRVPPAPREHLAWELVVARRHAHAVRAELRHISRALKETGVPLLLLKGAAYAAADLPPAKGRLFSDVDIMVPKAKLEIVEAALLLHGWTTMHHDAYDQYYYRTWMHELPPMQHIKRMTVIDVHHAILPETAPLHPDSEKLLGAAKAIEEAEDWKVLSPPDMVLHSAVHLFHDGEFDNGLRDLVDIDLLLRWYGTESSFWTELSERAVELELTRPLYYTLRYAVRLLNTPVPETCINAAQIGRPSPPLLFVMDSLFTRALLPDHPSCSDWFSRPARFALYLRANWLRMPPLLLARHLFRKALFPPQE